MKEKALSRIFPLVLLLCVFCTTWHHVSGSCQGKINVAIAMDASQSLGKLNFLHVKAFGKAIAEHLLKENEGEANVFAVAFARDVDVIVGEKMNVTDTIAAIDAFDKKLIPETNTNLAIDKSSDILQQKGDGDKPSVIFIVTDGRATSGLQVVKESAEKAAEARNILIAVGVGNDFAYEELLSITAGRKEHVLNGTFANLNNEVLKETLETICHLSATDPTDPAIERPKCQVGGTVSIGVHVTPALQVLEQQQLQYLLAMMATSSSGVIASVSDDAIISDFYPVSRFTTGSWRGISTTDIATNNTMLNTMVDQLKDAPNMPRFAVVIIDDTFWSNPNILVRTKAEVDKANQLGITVIALILDRQPVGIDKVLTTVFGTVNTLSVNSKDMNYIVTSGFNQLLRRMCTVYSTYDAVTSTTSTTEQTTAATTPPPLLSYDGPVDVHITLDVCQATAQNEVYLEAYGNFAQHLADKLVFGPSNASLTASLTYCSGAEVIAESREFIFESHYSLRLAKEGSSEIVDAKTIVNDVILRRDSKLENVGIIFITEGNGEMELQSFVNKAKLYGITLMAVVLTSDGTPSPAMLQKAAIIDENYVQMTYSELYTMPGLIAFIMQRIPSLFKEPIQAMIGITSDGTISSPQFAGVDYVLMNLRKMINSNVKDPVYTLSFKRDLFQSLIATRMADISRRIDFYSQPGSSVPDYVIIITNKPPLDETEISAAINRSLSAGLKVFLTGYTGNLSTPVETISAEIDQSNADIDILIDSSESVTRDDITEAYKASAILLWRLKNTVSVEVSTFDVNVHVEIPQTQFTTVIDQRKLFVSELSKITHLMTKPPLYKAIERLAHTSEDPDVRTVGVMFIADKPRYMHLFNVNRNVIHRNLSTLIVVDISPDGDIEGLEDTTGSPLYIIRIRNLDFSNLSKEIFEHLDSLGYSKYQIVFTVGQIISLEQKFNFFESMLEEFAQASSNYTFNTDFGLITMENNAVFDYFNIDMRFIIMILRRLMKVSDRGSETAIEYSSEILTHRKALTKKQGVSVVITNENPKFPDQVAIKSSRARTEDANHILVVSVGENLDNSSLLSISNLGDGDLCMASNGSALPDTCVGWLVNKLPKSTTTSTTNSKASTTVDTTTTTATTTTTILTTVTTESTTSVSPSLSTQTPIPYVCNADAQVGIGVTSSLQVRDVFEAFQDNITQSVGDDVKFKFLFFYDAQLFEATTELKNTDPTAFQSVVVEVNSRLTNLYTGRSNLIALILTDAKSAAGGISFDVFNSLSTYIEFVVFGIGQFSSAAVADMMKLTRNKPGSLIMVDGINSLNYDQSIQYLGKAVCDAVTKIPLLDIRTNITRICADLPSDDRFGVDTQNVWYPFDCKKFINCYRNDKTVRANVIPCPSTAKFNTVTRKCDMSTDVVCKEVTAEEYALDVGKIIDPPVPKVVNFTEECINNCFPSDELLDSYGYTYHPTNCSKFIVCRRQGFVIPGYTYTTAEAECPLGQFWDAQTKICSPSHLANCAADMCKMKSMFSFWNVQSCRHFYSCNRGISRLGNCALGKKLQANGLCVDDPLRTCTDPIVTPRQPCYNLPWTDATMYIDRTIGANGELKTCPSGKQYEHHTCSCSRDYIVGACQPVLSKTMDQTMTINNVYMRYGVAAFYGPGLLSMPQPSPLTDTFLVHLNISVSKSNQDTVILRSCPDTAASAFTLRLADDKIIATVKLTNGVFTLSVKIQFDEWNHVKIGLKGQKLVLAQGSQKDQAQVTGPIKGCQDSFVLGSDNSFFGEIDEIQVYDCIPDKYISIFN
ncbi:uncharacterized protein [Argopecten irradians]|uniref:uncharacterized protein n=1 Tax=Argopecten irradians TaxID=31199 RepID=UPI003713E859